MPAIWLSEKKYRMSQEDWKYLAELFSVFITAATKFLFSPSVGYYFGFSLKETFLVTTLGGITGILSFAFLGEVIRKYWRTFVCLFLAPFSKKSYKELVNTPVRKFSKTKRLIVKIKRKFGLAGLAFFTPPLISIPVGTMIGMNIYSKKGKVLFALLLSLLFWSTVLNLATPWVIEYISKTSTGL